MNVGLLYRNIHIFFQTFITGKNAPKLNLPLACCAQKLVAPLGHGLVGLSRKVALLVAYTHNFTIGDAIGRLKLPLFYLAAKRM